MSEQAPTTRVLLFDVPRLLRDIVQAAVAAEPGIELVGVPEESEPLAAAISRTSPDLLIVPGAEDELVAGAAEAFDDRPRLKVLALTGSGRRAFLWELAPRRVPLGEMSPTALVAAMRDRHEWSWRA